jgi:hypothetical protein
MTWKEAMFDKEASIWWGISLAAHVVDVETMMRAPCFKSGHVEMRTQSTETIDLKPTRLEGH